MKTETLVRISRGPGCLVQRYVYKGIKYQAGRWYRIDGDLVEELKALRHDAYDRRSPLLFDVATLEEAQAIVQEERQARREAALEGAENLPEVTELAVVAEAKAPAAPPAEADEDDDGDEAEKADAEGDDRVSAEVSKPAAETKPAEVPPAGRGRAGRTR